MKGKNVGYARVSTSEQSLELQVDALTEAGCASVFTDTASGARCERQGLAQALDTLQPGDTLLVWRLDRLGRSLPHLVQLIASLSDRGVHFRSLSDGAINTTTASGELIFHIFAALAQFERTLIRERTRAGLEAARARGRCGGRRAIEADHPKVVMAKKLHQDRSIPIPRILEILGISKSTLYRYLQL